ncbi:MAG: phenylacetate--CoA ligase family protein [Desulfobacteraceae bacterium]|nr:phenylacetate--CoA ligase family protein [Desulfobacteraceae bacterium]
MYATNVGTACFLFKYSLVKRHTVRYFRELLRNQYLSRDELEYRSWNRTKAWLQYAYEKVPYYKKRFDSIGLHPNDIAHPDDYCHVPVLTRKDLREHFDELVSIDARPRELRLSTTGGTTGEPVKVYHEKRVVRAAIGWRMLSWWGLSPEVDFASVYRQNTISRGIHLINSFLLWPTKHIKLNAAALDPESMMKFINQFNSVRPQLLHGYVGALHHLAVFIQENSLPVFSPKAIWVTSSPLTPVHARQIEDAFATSVYDQYGCCELYWLAAQCPAKAALHMFHDVRRIEFLDAQNKPCPEGEIGNISITNLESRLFPLIRYLNGDMGCTLPGICSCGVTLPLMDKVRGRVCDTLKLPNGKCINGVYLTTIFDDFPDAVRQFQVYQQADYSITVLVVPDPKYCGIDKVLAQVKENICKQVGEEIPIQFDKSDHISLKGGKFRFVRSDVH